MRSYFKFKTSQGRVGISSLVWHSMLRKAGNRLQDTNNAG